jgi:hypothetical protein
VLLHNGAIKRKKEKEKQEAHYFTMGHLFDSTCTVQLSVTVHLDLMVRIAFTVYKTFLSQSPP